MSQRTLRTSDGRDLSPTLVGFIDTWHQPVRKSAGMMAALFGKIDALANAHPDWRGYDLISHVFACIHVIIENDRLTGGHTRSQVISDLEVFIALENPQDPAATHREIATAVVDLLLNANNRYLRLKDTYLTFTADGTPEHPAQTFRLVRPSGEEDTSDPTLKAELEAVNIFQNLYTFDPGDRATAERYRSERMLERGDYDEVLYSVERRATSIHSLHMQLTELIKRMRSHVADIDYAREVIPKLDETCAVIADQLRAEERFAQTISEHSHLRAPEQHRLRAIEDQLENLVRALTELSATASRVKEEFEDQQDRQLFTYRRLTINPLTDLLLPAIEAVPSQLGDVLEPLLAVFLGVRAPAVPNLQRLFDKTSPRPTRKKTGPRKDPFDFGPVRGDQMDRDPLLIRLAAETLAEIHRPTSLSELLGSLDDHPEVRALKPARQHHLEWIVTVIVTGAYGTTDEAEPDSRPALLDTSRLAVARTGIQLAHPRIQGDDLMLVPRPTPPAPNVRKHR